MKAGPVQLDDETRETLRRRFAQVKDQAWVVELAGKFGWEQANRRYLASMREQGLQEMAALMQAVGVGGPVTRDQAFELVATAVSLYAPDAGLVRTTDERGQPVLEIHVADCPTYGQIEESGWHGVTACGTWHRRQGWYAALGVAAEDTLAEEKKWSDIACTALVSIPEVPAR